MNSEKPKLEWDKKYSVGFLEIDNQHKTMFGIINELIDAIDSRTSEKHIEKLIKSIHKYETVHFKTEEDYFKAFDYPETQKHISEHKSFGKQIESIKQKNSRNKIKLAFEIVDFLEDWLINHLMTVDQKYKECFRSHGLK